MKNKFLDSLKERYETWLTNLRNKGVPLAEYPCPECSKPLYAVIPEDDDIFDTTATCPYCLQLHFREVYDDGKVDTTLMGEAS